VRIFDREAHRKAEIEIEIELGLINGRFYFACFYRDSDRDVRYSHRYVGSMIDYAHNQSGLFRGFEIQVESESVTRAECT